MADAVSVAPDVYSVKFENDKVRVLEIRTEAGASSNMHSHPNMVLFAVTDCNWELTTEAGEKIEAKIPAGEIFYQDATEHAAKEIGGSSHAIAIELK